jgi:hypothetical protein
VAWLRQTTRNRAHDALRRRLRRRELPDDGALEALPDPGAEPGERLDEARREEALWMAFEGELPRLSLAALALESALSAGDLGRAGVWMARHHETTEQKCGQGPATGWLSWCETVREARNNRSSWLAALGAGEPVTWQAALSTAVRRCHAQGHALTDTLVGEGHFDGRWRWTSWTGDAAFSACLAQTPHQGPQPPLGTEVRLEVLP